MLILIINAVVGVWQEHNAENALDALKEMQTTTTKVIRNGVLVPDVPSSELVPGDVVDVRVGDKVPADVRIIKLKTTTIKTDEGSLTGESETVLKQLETVDKDVRAPSPSPASCAEPRSADRAAAQPLSRRGPGSGRAPRPRTPAGAHPGQTQHDVLGHHDLQRRGDCRGHRHRHAHRDRQDPGQRHRGQGGRGEDAPRPEGARTPHAPSPPATRHPRRRLPLLWPPRRHPCPPSPPPAPSLNARPPTVTPPRAGRSTPSASSWRASSLPSACSCGS